MSLGVTNSEKTLSEKQVLAIPYLVPAKSVSETDDLVGVNRQTGQPAPCLFRDRSENGVRTPYLSLTL